MPALVHTLEHMKRLLILFFILVPFLSCCAAIKDAHVGREDGKPSPFERSERANPIPDPTIRPNAEY
jgi:hypothetical protein